MSEITKITVQDKEYSFPAGTSYREVVRQIPGGEKALLVLENNRLRELSRTPKTGANVRFVTYRDSDGQKAYRRTLCLMMLKAIDEVTEHDPDYAVTVRFSIDRSFYCTLAKPEKTTEDFLAKVEARMRQIHEQARPIKKITVSTEEAIRIFEKKGLKDKVELFRYRMSSATNLYELDGFVDYYYGYMLDNTSQVGLFALKKYETGFLMMQPNVSGRMFHSEDIREEEQLELFPVGSRKMVFDVQMGSKNWGKKVGLQDVGDLNNRIVRDGAKHLILLQEAYHEQQIAAIASRIAENPQIRFVMIAGPSSSSKTTFSHRLSTQLAVHGIVPHPIPVDDYFVDRDNTPRHPDGSFNFECLEAIDVVQFNKDMLALLEGQEVEMPTFNFKAGKREYKGKKLRLGEGDIMVIEGIHCLNDALSYALPSENKFKIYISALTQLSVDEHDPIPTTDGRLIRRIVRDDRTRGAGAAATIAMWPSVRMGEENYIFPYQDSADVVFNSALIYELAVLKVYAQPLLFGIDKDAPEYPEAKRLLKFLDYFVPISSEEIPKNSLVREFIGGSCFDV